MSRLPLPSALLLALALTTSPALAAPPPADATAKLLAGDLAGAGTLPAELARPKDLASFAKSAKKSFAKYWKNIGNPMTTWASAELPQTTGETIFYPFAGADFPTAYQLYPNAGRYVLVALQTGGRVPDLKAMSDAGLKHHLSFFKTMWSDFARRGFFRTDDLKADTGKNNQVEGITPVLMAFSAALGFEVSSVTPMRIKADGSDLEPNPGSPDAVATWDNVRLTLRKDGRSVVLDYLWLDLSDSYLKKHPEAATWATRMASHKVFLKAASHLLQKTFFSQMRDILIKNATSIVQDETGLDFKDLSKAFNVTLYGRFERAHKLWSEGVQRDLITAYRERKDVKKLGFKFGYEKDAGSCVQVAVRKH